LAVIEELDELGHGETVLFGRAERKKRAGRVC
jgi:hypothetical protein